MMIDRSEFKMAGAAAFFGLCAQQVMAAWLALPWAVQTVLQGLITIAIGACALVVQHFVRRFLNRRWPVEAPPQNIAPPQGEAISQARFDLFDLVRRLSAFVRGALSRLRKSKRRRKES
jgi:hypothetical protein